MKPDTTETLLQATKFKVQRWVFHDTPVGTIDHEIVVHPGAVVVLPFLDDTDIIMIHNVRPAIGKELLELPAGTLEENEDPLVCAGRELEEETGYRAGSMEPLCEFYTGPGICTELMHAYVARDMIRTAQRLDATEQIRVEVLTLEDALHKIGCGEIIDGKSIAAITTFHLRQGQR